MSLRVKANASPKAFSSLISIDGPDGTGKSTFSGVLSVELQKILSKDKVKLLKPSYFDVSKRARYIREGLDNLEEKIDKYSQFHNSFFLRAMHVNYEDIILNELKRGKIVILDSSEIRALAFILDKGTKEAIKDTKNQIEGGILTCNVNPGIRIILKSKTKELLKNLFTKKNLDEGDPKNIKEMNRRIFTYKKAVNFIQRLNFKKLKEKIEWINININHVEYSPQDYFLKIIKDQMILEKILRYMTN